jgi:aryl-alcohol dehydrogenase-like predicted oxidoreductase
MRQRPLGNTGLTVSEITLGTVEIGMDYGFRGSSHYTKPERSEAVRMLERAMDLGVTLFDTARAYGEAEEIIGLLGRKPLIATKLSVDGATRREDVFHSVETSLRLLRADAVDLLQIHRATPEALGNPDALGALADLQTQGKARFLGASVYTEDEALAVIGHPLLRTVQLAFNALDQGMARRAFPAAQDRGRGVLVRSAFLRGVLTGQVNGLPEKLAPLRVAALRFLEGQPVERLAEYALRFCLSFDAVSSVVVGVRSVAELEANAEAAAGGPLAEALMARREEWAVSGGLESPVHWKGMI